MSLNLDDAESAAIVGTATALAARLGDWADIEANHMICDGAQLDWSSGDPVVKLIVNPATNEPTEAQGRVMNCARRDDVELIFADSNGRVVP